MADVRIYQPTKNAMQSGRANSKRWVLEFEPGRKQTDSLMGWVGSADTRNQLKLRFASKEAAIAYADKHGLQVMCIRIGNANDAPLDERRLAIWISYRDLAQLCRIGLEYPELHFEVVYGASDNARSWWDNTNAYRLGYRPQDRAEDHVEGAMRAQTGLPPDPVGDEFQGGTFCSDEFDHRADALP